MAVIGDANLPAFEQDVRVGFIYCSDPWWARYADLC